METEMGWRTGTRRRCFDAVIGDRQWSWRREGMTAGLGDLDHPLKKPALRCPAITLNRPHERPLATAGRLYGSRGHAVHGC